MNAVDADHVKAFKPQAHAFPATVSTRCTPRTAPALSLLCLGAALVVWLFSLPLVDPAALDDFGLISILPPAIWAAYAMVGFGFALSLQRDLAHTSLPLAHLVMLVLLLHATPAITYETLRYAWAWKHVGIVDYVQRHGELDAAAPFLATYQNWPGLFVVSAWVADLLRLGPLEVANAARFSPTFLNLLYVLVLPFILCRLTVDRRLVWTGTWFFVLGNWIGQDYFSPQGTAFLFYLMVIAICLGPLRIRAAWTEHGGSGPFGVASRVMTMATSGQLPAMEPPSGPWRAFWSAVALVLIVAITVTHPLTPVVLFLALAGLAFLGQLSIGYCLFALFIETSWLIYFASDYLAGVLPQVVRQFGHTASDITDRLVDTAVVSRGQAMVSLASRALTGAIALMALFGGLRRLLCGYRDASSVVLTLAPVALLAATSYGGEVAFRVYLFALPFLAFFAAAAFFPTPWRDRDLIPRSLVGALGVVFACGFVMANNGKDRQYRFTPAEVEATTWLYRTAPKGSLIVEGADNYPYQFMNYEQFSFVPISNESKPSMAMVLADPAAELSRWLQSSAPGHGFVILTRSQKAYVDDLGVMPKGSLDAIETALLASPHFRLVHANDDAEIFALNSVNGAVGNWVK